MNDSKTSNDSGKSKHKKKVSFSIFEVSTFDELAKLRKMREEELDYFVINKKKTNQYLNNLNQRNKILSLSNHELLSIDNNNTNSINDNISRNFHVQKNNNIPKPIKKEVLIDDSNLHNNISNIGNKNMHNLFIKKTLFSSEEEDMRSNELFPSIPQFNSIEKNEIINDINNLKSENNNNNNFKYIQNNNNLNINNIDELKNSNNNIVNKIDEKINDDNNREVGENINNNIDIKENNNIEVEENININNVKINMITLFNILEKLFKEPYIFKIYFIQEFFTNMNLFIDNKISQYIDYETSIF